MFWVGRTSAARPSLAAASASARHSACSPLKRSAARFDEALPGAVAIELVHNFSLVHDEIQDKDEQRHGHATIWARMGEAQAINVGDFLYTRAFRALTSGAGDAGRRLRALELLNDAVQRMITGQWFDIEFETRDRVSVDEYLDDGRREDRRAPQCPA